jgi:hypothetical protein
MPESSRPDDWSLARLPKQVGGGGGGGGKRKMSCDVRVTWLTLDPSRQLMNDGCFNPSIVGREHDHDDRY